MIVMKFGGSSLGSAEAIDRMAAIVSERVDQKPVVVVSAMGKTTDRLLEVAETAVSRRREDAVQKLNSLCEDLTNLAHAVVDEASHSELGQYLKAHFLELEELVMGLSILGEMTPRSVDAISSYGERISSYVISLALRKHGMAGEHVDSREVIITDDYFTEASPLMEETIERLRKRVPPLINEGKVAVMGGFIASTRDGATSTLGRGGSDFTASIVGASLGADEIQIWTDVDGVLTADPTLVTGARRLKVMSFDEASELAYFGAKVLHPATVQPAVEADIPVRVLNSWRPGKDGTLIVAEPPASPATVKSIAYKEDITVVDIHSTRMLMAHGFLARIFAIFDRYKTPVDMVTTSEVSVSLTIDRTDRLDEITRELKKVARVSHTSGQAIVCVVGENLRYTPGISGKLFKAIEDINVRMISQGASKLNISFVIDEKDLNAAIAALHDCFFSEIDEKVFA